MHMAQTTSWRPADQFDIYISTCQRRQIDMEGGSKRKRERHTLGNKEMPLRRHMEGMVT